MKVRLGALLGVCPECLPGRWRLVKKLQRRILLGKGANCKGCLACRWTGTWKWWLETEKNSISRLADSLAWQLWKVRDAYWEKTGERFEFQRD